MKKIFTLVFASALYMQAGAQSIYGDMETWRTYTTGPGSTTIMNPKGWFSVDSLIFTLGPVLDIGGTFNHQVTQTTTTHSGNYAVEIMSRVQGQGGSLSTFGTAPGVLSNAQPEFNTSAFNPADPFAALYYVGGLSTTTKFKTLTAWIKYLPKGLDNGSIVVEHIIPGAGAGGSDSVVGYGNVSITSTINTYTRLNVDIVYFSAATPTLMRIFFFSSDPNSSVAPVDSSTMYVDDVALSTTAVPTVGSQTDVVNVYPNPSNGTMYLHSFTAEKLTWSAFNLNGQMIVKKEFSGKETLDLSSVASGMYFYNITNTAGDVIQRGKFTIAK